MNLDKMVEIGLLFEQYKELLTDKQREIVALYYEEDYSLEKSVRILMYQDKESMIHLNVQRRY